MLWYKHEYEKYESSAFIKYLNAYITFALSLSIQRFNKQHYFLAVTISVITKKNICNLSLLRLIYQECSESEYFNIKMKSEYSCSSCNNSGFLHSKAFRIRNISIANDVPYSSSFTKTVRILSWLIKKTFKKNKKNRWYEKSMLKQGKNPTVKNYCNTSTTPSCSGNRRPQTHRTFYTLDK